MLFFQTLRVSPLGIRPRYKELLHLDNDNHHHHPCHHHCHLKGGRSWKHLVRRPEGSSGPRKGSLSGYDSHATGNSGPFSQWMVKFYIFCNNLQKSIQKSSVTLPCQEHYQFKRMVLSIFSRTRMSTLFVFVFVFCPGQGCLPHR